MSIATPHVSDVGTWFYTHDGKPGETVHVYATRVGRIPYGNTVNIYKAEKDKPPSSAKLAMFGIRLTSSKTSFNLGHVKMNPGDTLYAWVSRKGLEFKASKPKPVIEDPFKDLFG